MSSPVVTLNTPDESVFKTLRPELKFVGVDAEGDGITYSVDIDSPTWTNITPNSYSGASFNLDTKIVFANGYFLAKPSTGSKYFRSVDGINWEEGAFTPSAQTYNGMMEANGRAFFATSGSVRVMSPGDSGFTQRTISGFQAHGTNPHSVDVAYGAGLYVMVTSIGTYRCYTSPDTITWSAREIPLEGYTEIEYGNGVFVASNSSGFTTSVDGINWAPHTAMTGLDKLAFGNGVFVSAGGSPITSSVSVNGVDWATHATGIATIGVMFGGFARGRFSYVGTGGAIHSFDGINWYLEPDQTSIGRGFAYGNGVYVVPATSLNNFKWRRGVTASSDIDGGFTNLDNPSATDPFASGDEVSYVPENRLSPGDHYWSVRGKDPAGDNEYGAPSSTRTFSANRPPNPGIFMQFLT